MISHSGDWCCISLTHYLFEVPRQARVTHLVRCFSHSSAAHHAEIILGFTVEGMVSPLSLACPVGLPFDLSAHGCAPPVNSPSRGTSRVTAMAFRRVLGEQVRRVCAKASQSPCGRFLLYATRSRYYCLLETHCLIGPPSATSPSPDTTDRYPFDAVSAASAGVSGVSPALSAFPFGPRQYIRGSVSCLRGAMRHFHSCRRLPDPRLAAFRLNFWASAAGLYVGLGTFTCCSTATSVGVGPELAHRRKLLIGSLIGPSPHSRRQVAHVARCPGTFFDSKFDHVARIEQYGLYTRGEDVARGSHRYRLGVTFLRSSNVKDDGDSPRVYLAFCVVAFSMISPTPPRTVYSARSRRSARAKRWNRKTETRRLQQRFPLDHIGLSVSLAISARHQVLKAVLVYSFPLSVGWLSISEVGKVAGVSALYTNMRGV
ncbi:hypothetical protein EDB84DRAFT_1438312 [Lactarius hengduanensis]|nr:hypothetical protein EDB84DRAFT_1438312 [Lactarius hengduanensis]